jgi:hypothetical protein
MRRREAPNYYARSGSDAKRAVTQFKDPQPQRATSPAVRHLQAQGRCEVVGHPVPAARLQTGHEVPVIMWAYPREFGDADSASQVSGSPNSFTTIRGGSHMFLLLSGCDLRQSDDADHRPR